MKGPRNCRLRGIPALITMLLGLMLTVLLLPAYAQQEISPVWFDPWAAPNTAAAQSAKPAVSAKKAARSMKSAASSAKSAHRVRRAEKLHAKRAWARPTAS